MSKVAKALKETHDVELEACDKVHFEHNYSSHKIVDVVVVDGNTGEKHTFLAYDSLLGCFPY